MPEGLPPLQGLSQQTGLTLATLTKVLSEIIALQLLSI